jgi:hypothetical protein
MTIQSRRQFVERAAAAMGALSVPLLPATTSRFVDPRAVQHLASHIKGRLIAPNSRDYDSARVIFNIAFDRHPALIVRCANASDIAQALEFAESRRLAIALRSGGHSRAGFSSCDGGLVIDLSGMNRVEVDSKRRVARAQAGALVRDLDRATQLFGLATTSGGCPTVGLGGLTLGGGEGLLGSKYGLACDNLISAQLVTVDGRHTTASETINPDLFWAIRGGGGNFGVATIFEYRLHAVTDVLAGTMTFAPGRIPELLQAYAGFMATAPDEMHAVGSVISSKQGPYFHILLCHCGEAVRGNELLKPLRAFEPKEDNVRVQSYLYTQLTINPYTPATHFQTNLFLPKLGEPAVAAIAEASDHAPPNARVFIVPLNGAVSRVRVSDTAFALREHGFELDIMGRWNKPEERASAIQWVRALRDKLKPFARGVYTNQLGETSEELVRAAYGPNYNRLAKIKKKYDPDNILRLNQNITPA